MANREPQTDQEWQKAVDLADMHLKILDVQAHTPLEGVPEIDRARCLDLLNRGRARKVYPRWTQDDLQDLIATYQGSN